MLSLLASTSAHARTGSQLGKRPRSMFSPPRNPIEPPIGISSAKRIKKMTSRRTSSSTGGSNESGSSASSDDDSDDSDCSDESDELDDLDEVYDGDSEDADTLDSVDLKPDSAMAGGRRSKPNLRSWSPQCIDIPIGWPTMKTDNVNDSNFTAHPLLVCSPTQPEPMCSTQPEPKQRGALDSRSWIPQVIDIPVAWANMEVDKANDRPNFAADRVSDQRTGSAKPVTQRTMPELRGKHPLPINHPRDWPNDMDVDEDDLYGTDIPPAATGRDSAAGFDSDMDDITVRSNDFTEDIVLDSDMEDSDVLPQGFNSNGLDAAVEALLNTSSDAPVTKKDLRAVLLCIHDMVATKPPRTPTRGQNSLPTPSPTPRAGPSSQRTSRRKHRPGHILDLQDDVRKLVFSVMGRQEDEPLNHSNIATVDQVQQYSTTKRADHGPTIPNLRVDISTSKLASPWNKMASRLFANYFREQPGCSDVDLDDVKTTFMTHLQTLRKQWVKITSLSQPDSAGEMQRWDDKASRDSGTQRSSSLLDRRYRACQAFTYDSTVQRHVSLMESIPADVMSGDETDHHNGELRYVVKTLEWRSKEAKDFFMTLDWLHLSTRFGASGRATRGKFPHPRVRNSGRAPVKGKPVAGLPSNFYSKEWIRTLSSLELQELKRLPKVDLTFSKDIMRRALRYSHVIDGSTPPLPDDHPSLPPKDHHSSTDPTRQSRRR